VVFDSKCTICRRLGQKLFLKGEKCFSPKCPIIKRPYPPGQKKKRRPSPLSEYGRELREKQRLKVWYNLREAQLRKYVREVLERRGRIDTANLLIKKLESRLDNVVFRLGLAISRPQARQLVSHGYLLVNEKKVKSPSYQVKKGDKITIPPSKKGKKFFQNIASSLKKYQPPAWLKLDKEKLEGQVIGEPTLEEAGPPAEISSIFEFYSR
jgi:small subunit ribosomal protein S4